MLENIAQDGVCTDLFENLSVNSLKRHLSNNYNTSFFIGQYFKGIDRPFEGGGGDREYTHSIHTGKLETRLFFSSHFKGPSSQDQ